MFDKTNKYKDQYKRAAYEVALTIARMMTPRQLDSDEHLCTMIPARRQGRPEAT